MGGGGGRDRLVLGVGAQRGEAAKARALEQLYEPPESMSALSAAELRQLRDLLAKVYRARTAQQTSAVPLRPPA